MNKEAYAGDDAEHDEGEVIDGKGEVDLEAADGDPGAADDMDNLRCPRGIHGGPEPRDEDGGDGGEEQGDCRDGDAGELAAEGPVDEEAGEGKQRDEPEIRSG